VLAECETTLRKHYGADAAVGLWVDVTKEDAVIALYAEAAVAFGGIDICVSNAGIASAAPIEETTLALWDRNMSILSTGYFLVTREAFRTMKAQNSGGSIVVVASKNAMVASPGASAYCVAKASEVHLARCLALEGAPHGIRANVVNPDAVLRGSRIWEGEWGTQRAASNNTSREELERVYIERSMLKRGVYPEDIAEAIIFLASERRSAKSTGNIINVDAGHAPSFSR
jgi:NAD(P)-dependent dehydrogenase (short-subunit alcohol dehydrogenase family)